MDAKFSVNLCIQDTDCVLFEGLVPWMDTFGDIPRAGDDLLLGDPFETFIVEKISWVPGKNPLVEIHCRPERENELEEYIEQILVESQLIECKRNGGNA